MCLMFHVEPRDQFFELSQRNMSYGTHAQRTRGCTLTTEY